MATAQLDGVLRHLRGITEIETTRNCTNGHLLRRFIAGRDQAAFAALMQRHGRLVWSVCRHVLHHDHDAEDAFQATFLVLARHAGSIRRHEALSSWLHGVAYRVAMKAKRTAAIQRRHELHGPRTVSANASADPAWRELLALLDEEVQRLPETFRKPFVLCYLEGRSRSEAARELGWKEGTVAGRLARARSRLQRVLARRGVTLAALLSAAALARESHAIGLPPALVRSTLLAAMSSVAGSALKNLAASAQVTTLVEGVSRSLMMSRFKIIAFVVLALGMVLGAGLYGRESLASRPEGGGTPGATGTSPAPTEGRTPENLGIDDNRDQGNAVTGQVLDPNGKPIKDSPVALIASLMLGQDESTEMMWASTMFGVTEETRVLASARTSEEGRFRLPLPVRTAKRFHSGIVIAAAPGLALGWHAVNLDKPVDGVPVRLQPEKVVRGKLIDLEGQAVAGAFVRVTSLGPTTCPPDRQYNLDAVRPERSAAFYHVVADNREILEKPTVEMIRAILFEDATSRLPFWPQPLKTDAQGRFTIRGLDRTQPIGLRVLHERFADQKVEIKSQDKDSDEEVALALVPAQVIEGTVHAEDTGKPLARARVVVHTFARSLGGIGSRGDDVDGRGRRRFDQMFYASLGERILRTEVLTDDQGRFRASPMPGNAHTLTVLPPDREPYLRVHKSVSPPQGAAKHQVKITLPRGVKVQGRVLEEGAAKPLGGVRLDFFCKALILPPFDRYDQFLQAGPDGTFEVVLPPGKWHILANAVSSSYFPQKLVTTDVLSKRPERVGENLLPDAWVAVDLTASSPPEPIELKVKRLMLRGQVTGPDGRPASARVFRRWRWMEWDQPEVKVHEGRFEVPIRYPDERLTQVFFDAERGLGAVAGFSTTEAKAGPVTVKLLPCGTAHARFASSDGHPLPGFRPVIWLLLPPGNHDSARDLRSMIANGLDADDAVWLSRADPTHYGDGPRTDADGKLTLMNLIPGATYRISLADGESKDFAVESGKDIDLGDLVIKDPNFSEKLPVVKNKK